MNVSTREVPLRGRTVGEIVAAMLGATEVFRRFKLDFCCSGDIPLEIRGPAADVITPVERDATWP